MALPKKQANFAAVKKQPKDLEIMEGNVSIFSGRATKYLAEKIAEAFGQPLGESSIALFADGEFQPSYHHSIRGNSVFIIQSTFSPSDNLFELLLMIDAAKRASARKVVAVIPYFGFARQDRKDRPRVSIGAKLTTNLLVAAGVDRIVTMDLHSDQIQGFVDIPVDHLYASSIFVPYLQSLNLGEITMASPDTGGAKRAAAYAKFLNTDLVICFKQREKAGAIQKMQVIGDVKGKDVILVDDIIDTAGTICKAAELMMEQGANSVRAVCTHAVFSGNAMERISNSALKEVITADTLPRISEGKITVLSTASLFADVIDRIHKFESISEHFKFTTIL